MESASLLIIIAVTAILFWQAVLTFLVLRVLNRYKQLVELEKEDLKRKLIGKLSERLDQLERQELTHIQKINLLRFNPFNETGGDTSFTVSLLDANLNGVILTGLHTREKTRVYAKEVKNGKSNYELSKEEKKVLK